MVSDIVTMSALMISVTPSAEVDLFASGDVQAEATMKISATNREDSICTPGRVVPCLVGQLASAGDVLAHR